MALSHTLKLTLKRGALVAAANWPVAVIQAIADSLFKLLVLAPIVGGIFLVALVVGEEPIALMSLQWRDLATTIATSLLSRPIVLAAWLASLSVVLIGGSLFVFLIKAGAVGVLVRGERDAGPIEQPPLLPDVVAQASAFTVDDFIAASRAFFPRYARLGLALMAVYVASGAAYFAVVASGSAVENWAIAGLLTVLFVVWITLVNLVYLLTQIVIAADDCAVMAALRRVWGFLHRERRSIAAVFLVVLALVVCATAASFVAAAALSVIAFVPLLGLPVVVPLQLVAWALRGIVFQYIGLSSIAAYVKLYREARASLVPGRVADETSVFTGPIRA